MKNRHLLFSAIASLFFLCGCTGKRAEQEKAENAPGNAAEALHQLTDKAKDIKDKGTAEPIDFRKLKTLFPEKVGGLSRTETSGEKNGAMGFTISRAEARYSGDGGASAHLEILDTGGVAGAGTMALATWAMADIDKETKTGYEKTTKLEGYKAFEKYDRPGKSGELNVLVADRFVINISGSNLSVEQLKSILKDLDLEKLSSLK
jgi:hypothetical protein